MGNAKLLVIAGCTFTVSDYLDGYEFTVSDIKCNKLNLTPLQKWEHIKNLVH